MFRQYFRRRAMVARDADALIAEHGDRSPDEARDIAWSHYLDGGHEAAEHARSVVSFVDRRLGYCRQMDTATRYLEG